MKHLKIFEEFKLGTAYTPPNYTTKKIDIDGFELIVISYTPWILGETIFTVETLGSKGPLVMSPVCFVDMETAQEYIKQLIDDEKISKDIDKFVIRILRLDSTWMKDKDNNKEEIQKLNPTEIYNHIEKYINVLVDAYLAISTQRYKATFTKDVIRKGLVRLQQECKFKDLSRAKEAIKVFNGSMKPMMDDVLNSKNIETWKLGANGKKYYSVFKDFTTMVNI